MRFYFPSSQSPRDKRLPDDAEICCSFAYSTRSVKLNSFTCRQAEEFVAKSKAAQQANGSHPRGSQPPPPPPPLTESQGGDESAHDFPTGNGNGNGVAHGESELSEALDAVDLATPPPPKVGLTIGGRSRASCYVRDDQEQRRGGRDDVSVERWRQRLLLASIVLRFSISFTKGKHRARTTFSCAPGSHGDPAHTWS